MYQKYYSITTIIGCYLTKSSREILSNIVVKNIYKTTKDFIINKLILASFVFSTPLIPCHAHYPLPYRVHYYVL